MVSFNKKIELKYLPLIFIIFISSCTPNFSPKEKMLRDACIFLWEKQAMDGGWHSETHGIMKSGQSTSAFVFYNLLQVPESIYKPSNTQKEKALNFLRSQLKDGVLGYSNSIVLDYPSYATAYALRIFRHFDLQEDKKVIQQMKSYLLDQQFIEHRGFSNKDAAYGAWGFGEKFLEKGTHGHVDLSHTRRVLQSLQLTENQKDSSFSKAKYFLSLLQKNNKDSRLHPTGSPSQKIKYDGGFFASTVTVSTNKGDVTEDDFSFYRSYATATADGLLALLACGIPKDDKRVQDSFDWLLSHPNLEFPEGIPTDNFNQWHRVMFYYHLAVRGQAYRAMNYEKDWEKDFVNILLEKQNEDGSFSNPMGAANKEDDPLIATSFVLQVFF